MDNSSRDKFIFVLALAVFAAAVLAKLNSPLLEWDDFFLEAAKSWASGISYRWVFDYPPLYPLFQVLPFRIFGASPEIARLFNTLPVLATAWLIYLTAENLSGRRAALPAALLYLVNPVTIQGVQSLAGSDSSLLPLLFAFFSCVLSRPLSGARGRTAALSLIFALSLWAKVSSSIALIAGCALYLLAFRGRIEKPFFTTVALGVSGGILLFLLTWSAVSLSLWGYGAWAGVFAIPFQYFFQAAPSPGGGAVFKWGLELLRVVFWFSPFLLYLSSVTIIDIFRRGVFTGASRFLAFLCAFYFIGHIFIGGSNYGFPRYHAAVSPLLHVFAGIAFAGIPGRRTAAQWRYLIIPAFLFPVVAVIYADPELLLNLRLKQLVFSGDYQGVFTRIFLPLFAYTALPFAAGALSDKLSSLKNLKTAAITAASAALLGTCAALSVKQGLAAYSTSYQYGAAGKSEVLKLVSDKLSPGGTVMATPEFLRALKSANVSGPGWNEWRSEKEIYGFISKREPDFMKVKVGPENFGHLDGKKGNSYIVRVIDCSYRGSPNCTCHGFVNNIRYDDVNFSFVAPITSSGTKDVCEIIREKQKQSMQEVMSASFPHTLVKAFPANHKSFDISGMKRVSDRLVVMYGENNIFDVFSIDDALLILEEDRISETTSIQAWTLCIAQNQVARNLLRLYSNNPSLSAV